MSKIASALCFVAVALFTTSAYSADGDSPSADAGQQSPRAAGAKKSGARADQGSSNENEEAYGKTTGVAGDFLFGPSVSALAFPQIFDAGAEFKYTPSWGAEFDYGFLPQMKISSVQLKMNSIDGRIRWFPWARSFFVGFAMGSQTFTATTTSTVQGVTVNASAQIKSTFFAPHVGWRWVWPEGFFMGVDLGWQFASGASTTITTNITNPAIIADANYVSAVNTAQTKGNNFGNAGLPFLTLLHAGWLF